MPFSTLKTFCSLHATPGDETAVFNLLERTWQQQGLDITRLGSYAITATPPVHKKSDTLLLLAHADSPGFIVSSLLSDTEIEVLVLGGITPEPGAKLLLKTSTECIPEACLSPDGIPENWTRNQPLKVVLPHAVPAVKKGDRLCWMPTWTETDERIHSPFLDNRIACALVANWFQPLSERLPDYNVIVGATAMEEVNGFGANVLARHTQADAAIILDVTYENPKQSVAMGSGPVITLSDASILLSMARRDQLLAGPCPFQTEVYNYSGTDARAFPAQGLACPAIPLLLATGGNHSSCETIAKADLTAWPEAIVQLAQGLFTKN